MKTLFIGDTHIQESAIDELGQILQKDILKIDADECIHLGDLYDSNSPTPKELEFGSYFVSELKKKYKKVIVLAGTGRHSSLGGTDVTAYLKHLGVKPVGIEHEIERDGKKILLGHWMTDKSLYEYGSYKHTIKELKKKYDIVVLGHCHSPQDIVLTDKNKIFHLGSVRFQHWNEVNDEYKRLAVLENGKLKFIKIKNAIPMVDVYSPKEVNQQKKGTKVRLVIKKSKDYLNWSEHFPKWRKNYQFTYVLRELEQGKIKTKTKSVNQKEFVNKWLKEIKIKPVKELLTTVFEEEGVL